MIAGIITWLLKGWLSRWAITAEGEIKDGWRWLMASPVHFLAFVLTLSLAGNAWQWHARKADQRASAATVGLWQKAFGLEQRATQTIWRAIVVQNGAIKQWQAQGLAHQQASRDALREAEKRAGAAEAHAVTLDTLAAHTPPSGPECRTPAEILDRKDEL